jgi:hypothetical protein
MTEPARTIHEPSQPLNDPLDRPNDASVLIEGKILRGVLLNSHQFRTTIQQQEKQISKLAGFLQHVELESNLKIEGTCSVCHMDVDEVHVYCQRCGAAGAMCAVCTAGCFQACAQSIMGAESKEDPCVLMCTICRRPILMSEMRVIGAVRFSAVNS